MNSARRSLRGRASWFERLAAALVAALLFTQALAPPPASAQTGKAIAVAIGRDPRDLVLSSTSASHLLQNLVFDRLVGLDDHLQPFPQLVSQVPTLENGLAQIVGAGGQRHLEVTLTLRQGVTWSDGEPFTADDVLYQVALLRNPAFGPDGSGVSKIADALRVDDYTVILRYLSADEAKWRDPKGYADQGTDPVVDPMYFYGLDPRQGLIFPHHVLRGILGEDPSRATNVAELARPDLAWSMPGTGPYVVASRDPGASIVFTARGEELPQRRSPPRLASISFRVYGSVDDAIAALDSGDVQAIASDMLDGPDVNVINSLAGAEARAVLGGTWEQITLNLDNPILADRRVRQAIAFGLDRQVLVSGVMQGQTQVLHSQMLPSSALYAEAVARYGYDPQRADQLLREAGWVPGDDGIRVKAGKRMALNLWMTPATFRPFQAPLLQQQLQAIGLEVKVDFVPAQVFFAPTPANPQSLAARAFDMAEFSWVAGADAGSDARFLDHSRSIPTKDSGYAGGNYAGFRNARNDVLLDQGLRSLSAEFRKMAYGEAQEIWANELPIIPLYVRPTVIGASRSLLNCRPSQSASGETWNVEEWDLAS